MVIQCHACKTEISNEAVQCPKCGTKVRKPLGTLGYALIGVISLVAFQLIIAQNSGKPQSPEEAGNEKHVQRFQITAGALVITRKTLKDPSSVVWEKVSANEDATIICIEYQAKNSYGNMNKEFISFIKRVPSREEETWNKHCRNPDLIDMSDAAKAIH